MKRFFRSDRSPQPLLAPLAAAGRFSRMSRTALERLPPAAAPIAVTLVGGVALVVVLGSLLGREAADAPPQPQPVAANEQPARAPEPEAAPEAASARVSQLEPTAEEAAAQTAADLVPAEPGEGSSPDPSRTASILPALPDMGAVVPPVPVAESEEEVAALERIQRREVAADVGQQPATPEAAIPRVEDAATLPAAPKRSAIATKYVNLRAGPSDDAEVLMVVPALAEIEAEGDCNWCEVAYDGRSGYIYKTFISYR